MIRRIAIAAMILCATAAPALADGLYDDYYNYNRQQPAAGDNDNYYTPPAQQPQPAANGYYYPPPQPQPPRSGGVNCNTVADMPSCGSD